jgi:hypothetical protein
MLALVPKVPLGAPSPKLRFATLGQQEAAVAGCSGLNLPGLWLPAFPAGTTFVARLELGPAIGGTALHNDDSCLVVAALAGRGDFASLLIERLLRS